MIKKKLYVGIIIISKSIINVLAFIGEICLINLKCILIYKINSLNIYYLI